MKAKTLLILGCACDTCRENGGDGCSVYPDSRIPIGTIVDNPEAWLLVQMGAAVPVDEECEQAANMTQHQMDKAQHSQRRASAGIHPDDFEAFDAGEIDGYYPDGTCRPGPNASHFRDDDNEDGLWLP